MKLLFLVNSGAEGAAAHRAQAFAQYLPSDWNVSLLYREGGKQAALRAFLKEAQRQRPDIVYVMDCAYSGVLAGVLSRTRLIVDTGDLSYELSRSAQLQRGLNLALVRGIEQLGMRRSDAVVVRGTFHKELLETEWHLPSERVAFIPDGVDCDSLLHCEGTTVRQQYGLGNQVVIGLVGSMIWVPRYQFCYGWDIIEALALLPRDLPLRALLVGDGDGRAHLEARARELGVAEKIHFTGRIPLAQLPDYLTAMDICVSTQSNDRVGNVRTTGKLPLYLACGRYVISSDVTEARRVLPGIGSVLPYTGVRDDQHPQRLADEIQALLAHPERLQVGMKARQVAKAQYDYPLLSARVEALCRRLVAR